MSAAVGAALKKIAVALFTDPKVLKTVLGIVLGILIIIIMPIVAVTGIFSGGIEIDTDKLRQQVVAQMSAEEKAKLQFVEDTMKAIESEMTATGFTGRVKEAQVLYVLALSEYSHEDGFVAKLVGCFAADQTDEQLIANINAAFGTQLSAEDFTKLMLSISPELVEVAKSQLGNVGGEPYWSWYGFDSRVEWCACFVSWCANECGYIEAGDIPKFAGCTSGGMAWFKEHGQWQERDYIPGPGTIIFFDWASNGLDGDADHVGIVERVEGNTIYTIEGNSGDAVRQNSYPVGYYEIRGYGVPLLQTAGKEG